MTRQTFGKYVYILIHGRDDSSAKRSCTLNIPNYPFKGSKMRLSRGVHEETDLLNNVANVGTEEGQILKDPRKTTIVGRIINKRPYHGT